MIDESQLPQHIQDQIKEANKTPEPLFPIKPREYSVENFQTKEIKEVAQKVDKLIEAVNELDKRTQVTQKHESPHNGR